MSTHQTSYSRSNIIDLEECLKIYGDIVTVSTDETPSHWNDITKQKDGGITKHVIQTGDGFATPNYGAVCQIHIVGNYGGRMFEDRDVCLTIGDGFDVGVISGVETALKHFRERETAILKIKSKYAYGSEGNSEHNIPPGSDLIYDVELKEFTKARDHWDMTADELVTAAEKCKEKGTEYFKQEQFKIAKKKYKKVVHYVKCIVTKETSKDVSLRNLLIAGHLNIAVCNLKLNDPLAALHACDNALELDRYNQKGLYRRGLANLGLLSFEDAVHDFTAVLDIDPDNKVVKNQLRIANEQMKNAATKQKLLYEGMFNKFAEKDNEFERNLARGKPDVFSDIGDWSNDLAKGMMTLEQEMAAFGEQMPAPRYNHHARNTGKENEIPDYSDDD